MKRFYKFLLPLVAIVAMALPWNVAAQDNCDNGTITVATASSSTTTTSYFPAYCYYNYSVSEALFLATELEGLGGEIASMQFKPENTTSSNYYNNCEIYLANTTMADLSGGWVQDTSLHLVFTGSLNFTTTDWQLVEFDTAFNYTGGNLIVLVKRAHGSYASGGSFAAYDAGATRGRYAYTDSSPFTMGTIPGSASSGTTSSLPLYKFTGCYQPVACAHITDLTVVDIDTSSVTLSWIDTLNSGASYTVYSIIDSIEISGITDTFVTITGLTPNTLYNFTVVADCGGDLSSAATCSVRTPCSYIDSLPYTNSFETATTGSSTTFAFGDPCWTLTTDATQYPYVYVSSSSSYAHSGSRGIYWYRSSSTGSYGTYQCLVMPGLNTDEIDVSALQLKFWAKASSTSYYPVFHVGVMTNPADINTFTEVGVVNVGNSTVWTEYVVGLNTYTDSGKYVAIRANNTGSSWYAYVDDFTLEVAPNCPPVTEINLVGASTSGAYLTWEYQQGLSGTPDQYEIEYVEADDTTATPIALTTTEPYVFLSGLDPNTDYKFRVRVDCGGDDFGGWDSIVFTTSGFGCLQVDPDLPFSDTIGNGTTTSNYLPSYSFYNYGLTQQIFTAAEIGHGGQINSFSFMMQAVNQQRTYEIYMGHTPNVTANDFIHPADLTLVYNGGPVNLVANQWTTFNLTTPFNYNGSDNLVIILRDMTGSYVSGNYGYVHSAPSGAARYAYQDGGAYDPYTYSGGYTLSVRNNIILSGASCAVQATCAAPIVGVLGSDSASVSVAWAPGAEETSWNAYYRIYGDTVWNTAATGITTTSYVFTNLLPGSDYELSIAASCSEGEFPAVVTASTECALAHLPLSEDFQIVPYGNYERTCWYVGTTNLGTSYPYPYNVSLTGDENNRLCLFYSGGYLIFPRVNAPLNQLQIRFKLTQGGDNVRFLMGLMPNQELPISQMIVLDTLIRSDYDTSVSTVNITYQFTGIDPAYNNYHIAFWDAFNDNYSFLDDIVVEYIPQCATVTGLTATATNNSVTINWAESPSAATGFIVEYGPRGFTPGTGTVVSTTSAPVTISGLAHSTNYDAYVYSACSAMNDTSIASQVVQFATGCDVFTTLPYSTTFEHILPPGSGTSVIAVPNCWGTESLTGSTPPRIYYTTTLAQAPSQSYCLYFDYPGVAALPQMAMPLDSLMVTFHAYNSNPGNYGFIVGAVDSIGPGFSASFQPIDTVVFEYGNGGEFEVVSFLTTYTGNANRIALKNYCVNPTSTYAYVYVDNLTVNYIPSCIAPQRVHLTALSNVAADLEWTISTAPNYNIEYGPHGFTPGTGSTVTSTTNAVSLTGLTPYTEYDVRLVSVCSATDQSDTTVFTFTTLRAAPVTSYPYVCDFSDSAMANSWELLNGTQSSAWYLGTAAHYGTLDSMALYVSNDNGVSNSYNNSSLSHSYVYRTFTFNAGSYNIAFKWRNDGEGGSTYAYDYIRAYLVPAGSNITPGVAPDGGTSSYSNAFAAPQAGWIPVGGNVPLVEQPTWQSFSEDVVFTAPGTYSLVFYWGNDGSVYNDPAGAIDNVEVYLNTCPAPANIYAVSAGVTSINLNWDDVGTGYVAWTVEYGPTGFTQGGGTTMDVTAHPVMISGLDTLTAYDFYVRPICTGDDTGRWSRPASISTVICDNASIATNYTTASPTTTNYGPIGYSCYNYSYTQVIIDSADMANIGGDINAFAFLPIESADDYGDYYTNMDVYMANISESVFTGDFILPDATHVFQQVIANGNFNFTEDSWQTIALDTVFTWDGHSNVLFAVNRRHGDYSCSAEFSAHTASGNKMVYAYDDDSQYNINSPFESGTVTSTVGDLQLISCGSACPAPVISTVTHDYGSATVTVTGNDLGYELTYGTDPSNLGNAMSNTDGIFVINGLTPAVQYFFEVTQLCDSGVVSSPAMGNFTTDSLPCFDPTDVTVNGTTFNSAEISWTSNGNATSWVISVSGAGATRYDTATTNPYTITNLYADQQYSVMVMSICGNGAIESGWSEPVSFTTDVCTKVSGVTVVDITATTATVNWNAVTGSMGYKVYYGDPDFYDTEALTADVASGTTSYTITGLAPETPYEVYVRNRCTETLYSAVTNEDRVGFTTGSGSEGIYDVESGTLTLYPNPASSQVTLTVSGMDGMVEVEIVDMNGRVAGNWQLTAGQMTFDVSTLSQGAYFVRVTGEHQTAVRKLIVK